MSTKTNSKKTNKKVKEVSKEKVHVSSDFGTPIKLNLEMTDKVAVMIWDILNESIMNCPSKAFKSHAKRYFRIYQKALLKAGLPSIPKSQNGNCLDK